MTVMSMDDAALWARRCDQRPWTGELGVDDRCVSISMGRPLVVYAVSLGKSLKNASIADKETARTIDPQEQKVY